MSPDAAPSGLPHALQHLAGLGRALASADGLPAGLRVWVSVPTSRLGVATAVLGAQSAELTCSGCFHTALHVGDRVAAYYNRRFDDRPLATVTDTYIHYGTSIPRTTAAAPRLPDDFPERQAAVLADAERARLAVAYGCDGSMAGHRHIRASVHPVVVVGLPERSRADLTAWGLLPGADGRAVHRATTGDLDSWYRAPVVTVGPMPSATRRPWLAQVRPRLVITTTAASALAATPWPDVPVLSLLSRRSPSTVDAVELIGQVRTTPATITGRLGIALRPGHGLEIYAAHIPTDQPMPVADDDTIEEVEW